MSNEFYTLYGMTASLYTAKARAYLSQQGIPFIERGAGCDTMMNDIVPVLGRYIMPVVVTPAGDILQDGTDIIDHFEQGELSRHSVVPVNGVLRAVTHVFELFGGEGLLRPAMHYRWNFDEHNLNFLRSSFLDVLPASDSAEQNEANFQFASGRMRKVTVAWGVTPENMPDIEASYQEFLQLFERHLCQYPYLLGGSATLGDYGLLGPLFAHLGRDPYPANLMKQSAGRVYKWTERMNAPGGQLDHTLPHQSTALLEANAVPDTLKDLMRYVAEEYLGEITAHVEFANQWLLERPSVKAGSNGQESPTERSIGTTSFDWRGRKLESSVLPYRFYMLQRLTDCFDAADADTQASILDLFNETGLASILGLKTARRVERRNYLEVWGE
jgi:glutathione S-transferase